MLRNERTVGRRKSTNEKLADSLTALSNLTKAGRKVVRSRDLSRIDRQRLVRAGFLREVIKGWLIPSDPSGSRGETVGWYASFWDFCAAYCNGRFGTNWTLSAEASLLRHGESPVIPRQVLIHSPQATNHVLELPHGTSIAEFKQYGAGPNRVVEQDGLRLYSAEDTLISLPPAAFRHHRIETQALLAQVDESTLLHRLLEGGHVLAANRLAGGLRALGKPTFADEIVRTMRAADYDVRETNPFQTDHIWQLPQRHASPVVVRLGELWRTQRESVIGRLPPAPGVPSDSTKYLAEVDEIYRSDAYNSLSIEGYRVTAELIERVRSGNWAPDQNQEDRKDRDALAARGYWEAFQAVKRTIEQVLAGADAADLARTAHQDWYRRLFAPVVAAGILPATALAGYRNDAVYLRTSRYVPPRWEVVREAMTSLFDLMQSEPEPAVRAVLGHWLFGYIHPYPDGNGRLARFLMNVLLASGGYPWTVIRVEQRTAYLKALDEASIDQNIVPFAEFIAAEMHPDGISTNVSVVAPSVAGYTVCQECGLPLKDRKSVEQQRGPVCRGHKPLARTSERVQRIVSEKRQQMD